MTEMSSTRWLIWFLRCPTITGMTLDGLDRQSQRIVLDRWLAQEPGAADGRSQP